MLWTRRLLRGRIRTFLRLRVAPWGWEPVPWAGRVPEGGGEKPEMSVGVRSIMRKGNQPVLLLSPRPAIGLV